MSVNQPTPSQPTITTEDQAKVYQIVAEVRHRFILACGAGLTTAILIFLIVFVNDPLTKEKLALIQAILSGTIVVVFAYYFKKSVESKLSWLIWVVLILAIIGIAIAGWALYRTFY